MARFFVAIVVSLMSFQALAAEQIISCGSIVEMGSGLPNCNSVVGEACYSVNGNGDMVQPWFEVALGADHEGHSWAFMFGEMRDMELDDSNVELAYLFTDYKTNPDDEEEKSKLSFRFDTSKIDGQPGPTFMFMLEKQMVPKRPLTYKGEATVMTSEGEKELTFVCEYH